MCLILQVGAHMPAAAQRKHEIKHKLSCSGNSDVCINLPHWDSVAPARATQVNFGSATPQLVHQQERTQVSTAEEDEEEIYQRQWNHTENGTTQAMCCEDEARASSGCLLHHTQALTAQEWLRSFTQSLSLATGLSSHHSQSQV